MRINENVHGKLLRLVRSKQFRAPRANNGRLISDRVGGDHPRRNDFTDSQPRQKLSLRNLDLDKHDAVNEVLGSKKICPISGLEIPESGIVIFADSDSIFKIALSF